ncbi:MAG: hypothetical protein QOD72_2852 [Acidimicrobiaceae bacterium]|nr:hypothetical protein [Acidimicrobiaceae bacterium]
MRDYVAWHDDYDIPGSGLHLRLLVVQDLLAAALDECGPGPIRVISMCAGQGRDLLTVARRHRRGDDLTGRLVEIDRRNVDAARAAISEAGIGGLEIVEADAGRSDAYIGATPADVVLACGIFGNVTDDDVNTTVEFMPALCAPGATVIWTRAPRDDGIIYRIQDWFTAVGFEPKALVIGEGNIFGVGAAPFHGTTAAASRGVRLFDFFR